ncbi:hypothetical protein ACVWZM_001605 [Bradyrhizobium sp. USDA 4501]
MSVSKSSAHRRRCRCALQTPFPGELRAPETRLEIVGNAGQDRDGRLLRHRPRQFVAAFGDASDATGLPGLMAPWRQSEMGLDIGRLSRSSRIQRHVEPRVQVHRSTSSPTAGMRGALQPRIVARHRRRSAACKEAQLSTAASHKYLGFFLADQASTFMGTDWQRQAARSAHPQKRHTRFAQPKAYRSRFERQGAAA